MPYRSVSSREEIVFIVGNLPDIQQLLAGINPGTEVYILDPQQNGLAQMADILAGRSGIDAIHLLSHGGAGELQLGSVALNSATVNDHAGALAQISAALSPTGDLLLYGCGVAAGSDGQLLIDTLARITQANVAASTDVTGAAALGGDWVLEYQTGVIESALPFADVVLAGYEGVLSYNIAQTTYVPLPEPDVQTALKAIAGATKVSGNIQTVIAISATGNGTIVVYDQWEDGYEVDINNPTQATTLIFGDGILANGAAPGVTTDAGDVFNAGQTILLKSAISPLTPLTIDFDGRDKIGSTKAVSVSKAGWSDTPGTVLAGAVSVIDAGNAGKTYTLPIGQNVETVATATNKLFEYTSAHIIATQNGTTVSIDKDGNGTTDLTVMLNEGETYMVNGGLNAGGKITADKGIGVYLIAGDVASAYENRWFSLTPDEQWSSSYYAPVGTTLAADPAYVILYNPGASAITVKYDTATQSGTINVGAKSTAYVAMPASAAHFYNADSAKFFAVSVIDADATSNATHDWSYSLVPESYLTDKFIVAWGPGNNNSPMTAAANGNPVWVTTTANTDIYIDSATVTVKNFSGTALSGTLVSGVTYKYSVKALEFYRLFDTSDNDQSGLTVYTKDGTLITAAWGEDPSIAGAGNPFLDMGTTVLPFPDYVFTKSSHEAADSTVGITPGISNENNDVELAEQVEYKLTIVNRSVIEMFAPKITDSWMPEGAVSYVANSATLTVYDTDGTTVLYQDTDLDNADGGNFPLDGTGYTLSDIKPGVDGTQGLARGQKIVVTYRLQLPDLTEITKVGLLAGNNFQIDNSARLDDQSGTTKQSINLMHVETRITDGELFFYDSVYTSTQTTYNPGVVIGLQVTDADQNKLTGMAETLMVTVTNITTSEVENVTLTETGVTTGIFRGTLATSSSSGSGNTNGILLLTIGNSIKVEYTDPTTGTVFDNPTAPGISGAFTSGGANVKTALAISNSTPTDGAVAFYFDSGYTQATGNYSEGGSLYLQVTDNDQNFSATAVDTVIVKVTNVTTGEIENVTLDETGVDTGIFRKALVTTTGVSDAGNNSGVLRASLGDALKVEYTDPITGGTYDNPAKPGITSPYTSGNANTDTSALVRIKTLYLSADALGGDGTGDLNRIDPANALPLDTLTDSTYVLTSNSISSATPILSVSGNAAGTTQSILSTTGNFAGQSFTLSGTTIGRVKLSLRDDSTPNNTGRLFVYLRDTWNGPNLASASIDAGISTTTAPKLFDFTDVTGLTDSKTYYLVFDNQSNSSVRWYRGSSSSYSGGTALNSAGTSAGTYDYAFQVYKTDLDATPIQSTSTSNKTVISSTFTRYAQSFIVDGSGTYSLDKVSLSMKDSDATANTGYVHAYIRSAANGDNLASVSVLASSFSSTYQTINFDFSNNPTLNKGTTYYVVVDNQSSASIVWEYANANTYTGGSYYSGTTATTSKDFILNAYDPSGSLITTVPYPQGKQALTAGQYGGESFVIAGTGSYVLDKVSLNLDNQGSSNSGNLTLYLRSGGVTGTVLAQISVNVNTLGNSGVLGSVTFDLPNTTLIKGNTYYLTLTNGATGSIDWSKSDYDTYSSGQSFVNGTSGSSSADYQFNLYEATTSQVSASFTQSIAMTEPFVIPAGGLIKIISYVSGITGGTPTTGSITAHLTYGSSSTITNLSAFNYIDSGGGKGVISWIGKVANTVNIATEEAVQLVVTNNQSGLGFAIDYDSNTAPSRIELPTNTLIKVEDVSFYDDSYGNGGSIISTIYAGGVVYVRVKVSDPFGFYDVTGVTLSIDGPDAVGDLGSVSLTEANVVATNGAEKTYEYAWRTVNNTGAYNVSVIAKEGYENTITDVGNGSMIVTALDLGTPSKTQFIIALNGSDAGDVYDAGSNAFLRVTDLDKNTDPLTKQTVTAVVNGTNVTLTETDVNTGVFEGALTGFTNLTEGAVLSARYVDSNDGSDISTDGISVPVPNNEPPTATDNARSLNENVTATGTNLISTDEGSGIDSDPDNNTLTALAVNDNRGAIGTNFTLPSGALVNVSSNGNYTYNPNSAFNYLTTGESATDSFTYTITDGNGNTSTATAIMTINGVADPATSIPDNNGTDIRGQESVTENSSLTAKTFTIIAPAGLNKITIAGVDKTLSELNEATLLVPITINSSEGVMTITGYNSGIVTYNYDPTGTSRDHSGGDTSIIDQIAVTVTDSAGITSAPNSIGMLIADTVSTANADTGSVTEDNATTTVTGNVITGTGSATADTLGADSPTTVVGIALGATNTDLQSPSTVGADIVGTYGKLNIAAGGGYTYTLNNSDAETNALAAGANANDVFTYTIKDADGDVSHATVTVTVSGANDAPVVDLDTTTTGNNRSAIFNKGGSFVAFTNGTTNLGDPDNSTYDQLTLSYTTTNFPDGADEVLQISGATSGGTISSLGSLISGSNGTFTLGGVVYDYAVSINGSTTSLIFSGDNGVELAQTQAEALLDALKYSNSTASPTTGSNRLFSLTPVDGSALNLYGSYSPPLAA